MCACLVSCRCFDSTYASVPHDANQEGFHPISVVSEIIVYTTITEECIYVRNWDENTNSRHKGLLMCFTSNSLNVFSDSSLVRGVVAVAAAKCTAISERSGLATEG